MESGNMDHAHVDGQAPRPTPDARPDALLRHLVEHAEYDLALLFTQGQYLLYSRVGQELRVKGLAPEVLRAAFVEEPVDSGWLPPGVVRWGSGPAGTFLVRFVPPGRQTLRLVSERGKTPLLITVPLPGLVFAGVNASAGGGQATYYIWAVAQDTFAPTARLYQAPFPNVYADGHICFGTNRAPEVAWHTLEEAWQLFIASPFNADMASGKSQQYSQDVRRQLCSLEEAQVYPVEDLRRLVQHVSFYSHSPTIETVSDAVAYYLLKEKPHI